MERSKTPVYRITEDEARSHLVNSGDGFPESTLANARDAGGQFTVVIGGATLAYDAGDGFYWLRTNRVRIDGW